jgi:hypothetical protein
VLQLGHMLFGRPLFGERPGQHEFRLKNRSFGLDHTVQRCRHEAHHRVPYVPLNISKDLPGIPLIPGPVERLLLDLAALLPPQPDQGHLIISHHSPSVGAPDEIAAFSSA